MTALATAGQIRAIQTARRAMGMDEASYRAALAELGVSSSKELSSAAANAFLDRLNGQSAPVAAGRRPAGAMNLSGPYAGVCRALWLTAWNLGLVRDRTDRALVAFVERQTGIAHLNWVRDPADSARVIEALKSWISREAGVDWPTKAEAERTHKTISRLRKLEIILRQRLILGIGNVPTAVLSEAELDQVMQELGRQIRARQKEA